MIGRVRFDKSRRNFRQYPTPPSKSWTCFRFRGMNIWINADTFTAFGRTPAGEMQWSRKSASVVTSRANDGESFKLCLLRRSRAYVRLDVSLGVGVEYDHIVEVGCHLLQALDNLVDNLDAPPGRSTAALWYDEAFREARGSS